MATKKKRKCNKGYACGNSCISKTRACRKKMGAKAKTTANNYAKIVNKIDKEKNKKADIKEVAKITKDAAQGKTSVAVSTSPKGKTPTDAQITEAERFRDRIMGDVDPSGETNLASRGMGVKITRARTNDLANQVGDAKANSEAVKAIRDSGRNVIPVIALDNEIVGVDEGSTSNVTVGGNQQVLKAVNDAGVPFTRVLSVELADRRQADSELKGWDLRKDGNFILGQEQEDITKGSFEDGAGGSLSNAKKIRVPLKDLDSSAAPNPEIVQMLRDKSNLNVISPVVFEVSPGKYKTIMGDTLSASMKAAGDADGFGNVYVLNNNADKVQALKELGINI